MSWHGNSEDADLHRQIDVLAHDQRGQAVLMVEVKGIPQSHAALEALRHSVARLSPPIPYAMLVDPRDIVLFAWDGKELKELQRLETPRILRHYDPHFGDKRVFEDTLQLLVEAWIRDVAFHWKSAEPPGYRELKAAGLAARLADGTTQTGVTIGRAALR